MDHVTIRAVVEKRIKFVSNIIGNWNFSLKSVVNFVKFSKTLLFFSRKTIAFEEATIDNILSVNWAFFFFNLKIDTNNIIKIKIVRVDFKKYEFSSIKTSMELNHRFYGLADQKQFFKPWI